MGYLDFRDWLKVVDNYGELKHISGASWDLEMGSITEIIYREGKNPKPAILFDEIPGYPKGYRTLFGLLGSPRRIATTLGLPENQLDRSSIIQNWRKKNKAFTLIPPKFVTSGPVQANSMTGDKIDLFKLQTPRYHELDGGRYIGTGHAVIQKDPDSGWVNLGTYRVMLVDHNRLALHILESKHGGIIMHNKYFSQGKVMPVAIVMGADPALWLSSIRSAVPWGVSEYDYAGGIKGKPIEVTEGKHTGLPLPADAEIVIEGECHPGDLINEGPFGEWTGYYGNLGLESVPEPVIRVKAVYYRDDPILTCSHTAVPPNDTTLYFAFSGSVTLWDYLEASGIPGVKDVWCHEVGQGAMLNVVSIKQMYAGHAREAGLAAATCRIMAFGRYTVVVDDDIDPSNMDQVIWAMGTRSDPTHSIQILERCRSSSADTVIPPEEKRKTKIAPKPCFSSRAIIDACRPYEWKTDWYPVAKMSPELRAETLEKWEPVFKGII